MKRIMKYIFAAAAITVTACDNNIPQTGSINNALVEEVVLDEFLQAGVTLEIGKTLSLPEHISALPEDATNNAQYYESSDRSKATVSELGILEAKAEGECVITVSIGSPDIYATFDVTVVKPAEIAIKSLRFNYESYEVDKDGAATFNMKSLLYVSSVSETDDATEKIIFTSSATDVATIDDNGVLTINKLGETTITATAAVSTGDDGQPLTTSIAIKFYRLVEHERFPGDLDGTERAIMSDYDAATHTDGGWGIHDFGRLDTGTTSWANTGARNSYRYAMFDNRLIAKRTGGAANDLPTATNGTAFCWTRPARTNAAEGYGVYFVVDMMEPLVVSYFRIVNISNDPDDRGVFLTGVSEILGSNDAATWTSIATGIRNFNARNTPTHVSNTETIYPLMSTKAEFANTTAYRYIKFVMEPQDKCYGYYDGNGATDKEAGSVQVAELFMGCKSYTE